MKCSKGRGFRFLSGLLVMVIMVALIPVNTVTAQAKTKEKIVILYFSATGTTESVAKKIKKSTGGQMIEIMAKKPYTDSDLDWGDDRSRVVKEHESADSPAKSSVRPQIRNLKKIKEAVKDADVVYIGYPIWWGEAPHIVYSLVENVSLKKKTVVPFCTSISSGMGNSAKNLKKSALISATTKWLAGKNFYNIPSQNTVDKWVQTLMSKSIRSVSILHAGKNVAKKTLSVRIGESKQLRIKTSPSTTKNDIKFESSNKKIVTVNKNGKLTAKKSGSAQITVTVSKSGYKKVKTWVKISVQKK